MHFVKRMWQILRNFNIYYPTTQGNSDVKETQMKAKKGTYSVRVTSPNQMEIQVKKGIVKAAILNDIHSPYYYPPAVGLALTILKEEKPDIVILNGDIIDCFAISKFRKTGRERNIRVEIEVTRQILKELRKSVPHSFLVFVEGNHEFFLQKYIYRNAPALAPLEELELKFLLRLDGLGIVFLPRIEEYGSFTFDAFPIVKFTDEHANLVISVFHGDGIPLRGSTINKARNMLFYLHGNFICGHWHQSHFWEIYDVNGFPYRSYVVPSLAYPKPHWVMGAWELGFAFLEIAAAGNFNVEIVKFNPVQQDATLRCKWKGKEYKVPLHD